MPCWTALTLYTGREDTNLQKATTSRRLGRKSHFSVSLPALVHRPHLCYTCSDNSFFFSRLALSLQTNWLSPFLCFIINFETAFVEKSKRPRWTKCTVVLKSFSKLKLRKTAVASSPSGWNKPSQILCLDSFFSTFHWQLPTCASNIEKERGKCLRGDVREQRRGLRRERGERIVNSDSHGKQFLKTRSQKFCEVWGWPELTFGGLTLFKSAFWIYIDDSLTQIQTL